MDTFATSPVQFVWQLWTMQRVWCANTLYQSLPFNWQSMKWQSRPFGEPSVCRHGKAASLKAPPCTNNACWDFSRDEEPLHLSFWMFCIVISQELIGVLMYIILTILCLYSVSQTLYLSNVMNSVVCHMSWEQTNKKDSNSRFNKCPKMKSVYVQVTKPSGGHSNYDSCLSCLLSETKGGFRVVILWSHKAHRGKRLGWMD